jgi:hypothetical protein
MRAQGEMVPEARIRPLSLAGKLFHIASLDIQDAFQPS